MPKICRTCSAFSSSMTACPPLISVTENSPSAPVPPPLPRERVLARGEGLCSSANLHTVFLNCIITQFKPQAGLVWQRHVALDDLRALMKELEP